MKRFLSLLLIACLALPLSAQSGGDYYYYKDERIPLRPNPARVCVITGPSASAAAAVADGRTVRFCTPADTVAARRAARAAAQPVRIQPCYLNAQGGEVIVSCYVHVKLRQAADLPLLQREAARLGLEILGPNKFMPLWYKLALTATTPGNTLDAANRLYETGLFEIAEPSQYVVNEHEISYDTYTTQQWGLYNRQHAGFDIAVTSAWNYTTGRGVTIAIVDGGVDRTHPDLAPNMHPLSYDAASGTSPARLYGPHGTHCAGIAAAVRNNGIGIAGVAPDATLMDVSVGASKELQDSLPKPKDQEPIIAEYYADAINWAWQHGADVINCSWGFKTAYGIIISALDNALDLGRGGKGCVVVKSGGNKDLNGNSTEITFPGWYRPEMLVVAAIAELGEIPGDYRFGSSMDVAAPGNGILSTIPGNDYGQSTGTSMAAAHVSGLAALILSRNPTLTGQQVRDIIERTAEKISYSEPYVDDVDHPQGAWNSRYGYGVVNAYKAVINTPLSLGN